MQGGQIACSRCRAPVALPDRARLLASAAPPRLPPNDPALLAQLRVQDGRPRLPTPTLQAVLGGNAILPGREQEAIAIWQSLRARAQSGDVAASEDLSLLTLMIAQLPSMQATPAFTEALSESALDAAVLPRHRQEQLGRLCRLAASRGDRARAQTMLSMMTPGSSELESDSEYRVSGAVLAALDRDGQRILALVGPQKDAVPIADSLDGLASVFRAHAYELGGNVAGAAQILRELPDPRMLELVRGRFPSLGLCARSGGAYTAAATQEASQRAGASAGAIGMLLGAGLGFGGVISLLAGVLSMVLSDEGWEGGIVPTVIGVILTSIGVTVALRARAKGRRAAWLRANGLSLTARVVNAQRTGTTVNDVPLYRFALQVAGPRGPYAASFDKLVPEHQVAMILGQEVRVRADPANLGEVILEE